MLNENLKKLRKSKGLTQEELALSLNVVRQTVSKWEQGLSVPDSDMLIRISERFEVPVSHLLGEVIEQPENIDRVQMIAEKLALINEQLAAIKERRRKVYRGLSIIALAAAIIYSIIGVLSAINMNTLNSTIIGGADEPTSIMVYSSGISVISIVIIAVLVVVSICGICLTRRR